MLSQRHYGVSIVKAVVSTVLSPCPPALRLLVQKMF